MKKRILQLTGSFHNGGSERQAAALSIGLRGSAGYEVFLATLNLDGPLLQEVREGGFMEIPEFPLSSFYNANFFVQVRRCSAYLRENEIDLIHTHDFYTNIFGMAAATLAGTKVRIASKRETSGMRSGAQDMVEKAAFGRATKIVANSDAVRRSLKAGGITDDKIAVIRNGLDVSRFQADQPSMNGLELPSNARLITLVANLRHDVKNVPMFLRAARRVAEVIPDAHFVIAGEGGLQRELETLADSLQVSERTHFVGRCDNIPGLLSASYACALSSNAEGFANAIIEYMAAGKPVVATDVGGAAEAVEEGRTGYLVSADDDAAMAERLIELLREPEKAAAFGAAGREIATSRFSRETQLSATVSLYDPLLGR